MYRYVYNVSTLQRRGPIAAEFSGPGPAAIALPTLFGSAHPSPEKGYTSKSGFNNFTKAMF